MLLLSFSFFFLLGLIAVWGNSCRMAEVQFKMTLEMANGLGTVPSSSIQPPPPGSHLQSETSKVAVGWEQGLKKNCAFEIFPIKRN